MFFEVLKYSSISTKTRAMYKKLLKLKDYSILMDKNSVVEVAEYLKSKTNYKELLSNVSVSMIHRGQLEDVLIKQMINDYDKIFHHIRGDVKVFLQLLYDKYEIENLKVIFRILEANRNIELIEDSFTFLSKNADINITKLIESKTSKQLINNLKGTIYYEVLKDYTNNESLLNLFNIETSLDQYYFSMLQIKNKKLVEDVDRKTIYEALTKQIDIMNILWIYRSKKYFKMDREKIYNNMIHNKSKLKKETIKELIDTRDEKQFHQIIKNTIYGEIFKEEDSNAFENNYKQYIYKMHLSNLRKNNFSIVSVIAYIHLKEFEIANIISIIEGIRYNIDKEIIKQFIIS